jgi:Domain of unknown function (DUF4440)
LARVKRLNAHLVIESLRFVPGENMKRVLVAVALLLSLASAATAQEKQQATKSGAVPPLEVQERKLWEAFKNKDKATLSALLDGGFRQFEEGLSTFGDKKTEVNVVDGFELISYTLNEFTVKSIGPNAALVTYIAQYEGKSGGEISKGKSVFGEVWIRAGNEWKDLYMQETYVK